MREYTGADPAGFVASENVARRHLSASQLAIAAGRLAEVEAERAKQRQVELGRSHGTPLPPDGGKGGETETGTAASFALMGDPTRLLQLVHAAHRREPVPAELAPWLADLALSTLPAAERLEARDACLRRAAALVPGRLWAKVTALRDEIRTVRHEMTLHRRFPPAGETITACVVDALLIDPEAPSSVSQLLRIIGDEDDELLSSSPLT